MHAIQFRLKRSYQSSLKWFNKLLEKFQITCARFDLLNLVGFGRGNLQSAMWKVLGVSRPVVSRMLKALEEKGWVRRSRPMMDRRQRWVELTELGRQMFGLAVEDQTRTDVVEKAWDSAVEDWCFFDRPYRLAVFDHFQFWLDNVRDTFHDRARVPYEWNHEDEWDEEEEEKWDAENGVDEDLEASADGGTMARDWLDALWLT